MTVIDVSSSDTLPICDQAHRLALREGSLPLWTVYKHPKDYADKYVARMFKLDAPTDNCVISEKLEELRTLMQMMGLVRTERNYEDDSVIVETWL